MDSIISIGWDVGGWLGSKQGIAICKWDPHLDTIEWISPNELSLPAKELFTLDYIFGLLTNKSFHDFCGDAKIVISIDSPLGVPTEYLNLLNGKHIYCKKPSREIESRFAYRDTERHIFEVFGKKPLSAPFDKLGSNATVAISHVNMWCDKYGFSVHPFTKDDNSKCIIEVYPALVKSSSGLSSRRIIELLPHGLEKKPDAYDASICSILGIIYAASGCFRNFPKLVEPTDRNPMNEGWIYYISPDK